MKYNNVRQHFRITLWVFFFYTWNKICMCSSLGKHTMWSKFLLYIGLKTPDFLELNNVSHL